MPCETRKLILSEMNVGMIFDYFSLKLVKKAAYDQVYKIFEKEINIKMPCRSNSDPTCQFFSTLFYNFWR